MSAWITKAWITKEWSDEAGKLRREKVDTGTRGVKETDRFVVDWIEPTGNRCREKISVAPAGLWVAI